MSGTAVSGHHRKPRLSLISFSSVALVLMATKYLLQHNTRHQVCITGKKGKRKERGTCGLSLTLYILEALPGRFLLTTHWPALCHGAIHNLRETKEIWLGVCSQGRPLIKEVVSTWRTKPRCCGLLRPDCLVE